MKRVCCRNLDILLCMAIMALPHGNAYAQAVGPEVQEGGTAPEKQADKQEPQTATGSAKAAEKKGSWLLAPIPINSPAIGAGLEWAVARVFPINSKDEVSPPSTIGIGGVFTNNGSRAVVVGGRLYLKEDKFRIATAFGTANVNLDI